MKEVTCTEIYDVSIQLVSELIIPELIIECIGTYDVHDVYENGETILEVGTDELEATFAFTELKNGYKYRQVEDNGPYEEMVTKVTYKHTESKNVSVTFESYVSFPLPLGMITDRIGAWNRKKELEQALLNLTVKLDNRASKRDGK